MKRIESFDCSKFHTLESEKMSKIVGGGGSSQLNTVTVTPSGGSNDGADDLSSGERQDAQL